MAAKTEVFPAHIKPVHPGVYEVPGYVTGTTFWARWTGDHWKAMHASYEKAAAQTARAHNQNKRWRGLAENPQPNGPIPPDPKTTVHHGPLCTLSLTTYTPERYVMTCTDGSVWRGTRFGWKKV